MRLNGTVIPPFSCRASIEESTATAGRSLTGAVPGDCAGCGGRILDRYFLLAVDKPWHVGCLKCGECKGHLDSELTCYSRQGKIYCKEDYFRLFSKKLVSGETGYRNCNDGHQPQSMSGDSSSGSRKEPGSSRDEAGRTEGGGGGRRRCCARCGAEIGTGELVMRARHLVFHWRCFTCHLCRRPLLTGDLFGLRDERVYCKTHYLRPTCDDHLNLSVTSAANFGPSTTGQGALGHLQSAQEHHHHHHHHLQAHQHQHDLLVGGSDHEVGARNNHPSLSQPNEEIELKPGKGVILGDNDHGVECSSNAEPVNYSEHLLVLPENEVKKAGRCKIHGRSTPKPRKRAKKEFYCFAGTTPESADESGPIGELQSPTTSSRDTPTLTSYADGTPCSYGNGGRCKRMRTSFKHQQLRAMKEHFTANHNPDAKELKLLAQKTGLSKRVLQVWFQNARAKWRRSLLRQQSMGPEVVQESRPLAETTSRESFYGQEVEEEETPIVLEQNAVLRLQHELMQEQMNEPRAFHFIH